jgi:hypothetical protein
MRIADRAVLVTGANRLTRGFEIPSPLRTPLREASSTEWRTARRRSPDPMSETLAEIWRSGAAKAMERENAAFVPAEPVMS